MDNQCMSIGPPNQHKKDKQVAAREYLQEMFHGSIDREVVTLILAESDYNGKQIRLSCGFVII